MRYEQLSPNYVHLLRNLIG